MPEPVPHSGGGQPARRVLVVGQLDGYANGVKPREIARILSARGHQVNLVDTYYLSRASADPGLLRRLPGPSPARVSLYVVERAASTLSKHGGRLRRHLSAPLLRSEASLRARILRSTLPFGDADLVVVETPTDAFALLDRAGPVRWYDCPTPWADELLLEGRLNRRQHRALRNRERTLFESVDVLSFHWQSYAGYARDHYGISGDNLVTLDFGCTPVARRAEFASPARIVYLGSLSSQFIDLPLLSRLSRLHPGIDVYGGPPPDPSLGLNYRGWAPPETLSDYQLGLVTCTQDELRRRGFSAKHLQYFAHGLPVLVPRWRVDDALASGSIPYDEDSFRSAVESVSEEAAWREAADQAYEQAKRYSWDRTLAPLLAMLDSETPRA